MLRLVAWLVALMLDQENQGITRRGCRTPGCSAEVGDAVQRHCIGCVNHAMQLQCTTDSTDSSTTRRNLIQHGSGALPNSPYIIAVHSVISVFKVREYTSQTD